MDVFKTLERIFRYAGFYACQIIYGGREERFRVDTHTWHVAHYRTFIQRIILLHVSVTIRDICIIRNITFRIFVMERTRVRVQRDGYASTLRKNIFQFFNKYLFEK